MTDLQRLQWLEELRIFTKQFREAPVVREPESAPPLRKGD